MSRSQPIPPFATQTPSIDALYATPQYESYLVQFNLAWNALMARRQEEEARLREYDARRSDELALIHEYGALQARLEYDYTPLQMASLVECQEPQAQSHHDDGN
jgi:hypothetical protein